MSPASPVGTLRAVHLMVPEGIHDPGRPSGGNTYDRMVGRGLAAIGWRVEEQAVPGSWPRPDAAALRSLAAAVAAVPDGGVVLVDGLLASAGAEVLVPQATRLRLVVLMHLPMWCSPGAAPPAEVLAAERSMLRSAAAVVATSDWTRDRLVEDCQLPAERVHVALPGVAVAPSAAGTDAGGQLLCVAAVTPEKGHDVLLAALAALTDRPWRCMCVGPVDRDPGFAREVAVSAAMLGTGADGRARVVLAGPQTGRRLDASYAAADLLVLPSRVETYGMVVTEALARGLPVIAADVGGVPEALGDVPAEGRPGLLVPPGDAEALAQALRRWLDEAGLRDRLRRAAALRRRTLAGWSQTTGRVAEVLAGVAS